MVGSAYNGLTINNNSATVKKPYRSELSRSEKLLNFSANMRIGDISIVANTTATTATHLLSIAIW